MLENLRFSPGEEATTHAAFVRQLALYCDVPDVNDAFGTAPTARTRRPAGMVKFVAEQVCRLR